MTEKEPTPEELEEIRKKEARKDKLHQNYLKRKARGKQKEYEERTKVTVIVFFHAVITVGGESIFCQVEKYPHIVSCNLNS